MNNLPLPQRPPGLGLRGRLALFFVAIVVVPLVIALLVLGGSLRQDVRADREQEAADIAAAVHSVLDEASLTLGVVVDTLVTDEAVMQLARGDAESLQRHLDEAATTAWEAADFIVVTDPGGSVVAAVADPLDAAVTGAPRVEDIGVAVSRRSGVDGAILVGRELRDPDDRTIGFLGAGRWLDASSLAALPRPADGGVAVLRGDRIWASSGTPPPADASADLRLEALQTRASRDSGLRTSTDAALAVHAIDHPNVGADTQAADLLVWSPVEEARDVPLVVGGIVLVAAAVAAVAGWLLAGSIIAPIGRAVQAASAIAAGELGGTVPVSGGGRELDALGHALNAMNVQLAQRVEELEDSKDQLRRSLARLGETLSSSLDLDRTLVVVTETAMETLSADQAVLMLFTPERDALYAKVGRGVGAGAPRLRPGQGRLGWVAATGLAARIQTTVPPGEEDLVPPPEEEEPASERQLLVPLVGRGETLGVLSLMRTSAAAADFADEDLDTLQSFAAQAAVALENVLLHEEAQRRSLTDALTGLWNFRHFEAQAAREFESAIRFDRPLSLLVLDVDHFKRINDDLGHQAGDEVLREIAGRIRESARAPDLVARYGGEEFVVLLPGANPQGAHVTAERMRRRLASTPYVVGGGFDPVKVTCSIGVASAPEHAADVITLLRRADEALYHAKEAGRNRVVVSGAALSDTAAG